MLPSQKSHDFRQLLLIHPFLHSPGRFAKLGQEVDLSETHDFWQLLLIHAFLHSPGRVAKPGQAVDLSRHMKGETLVLSTYSAAALEQ